MSNKLHFITSSSATSVSDLSITGCFTAEYDNYKVLLDDIEFSDGDMFFRFINASGTVTSASYDDAVLLQRSYGSFADNYHTGQTYLGSIGYDNNQQGGGATEINIYNPFSSSLYTFASWSNTGMSSIGTPVRRGIGVLKVAESHTGINFVGGATISNVNARVYGVK